LTGWPVLDVAIGLSFMFFVLSVVCSSINEGIATVLNWRAKTLEQWIGSVLADPTQLQPIAPGIDKILTDANVPKELHDAVAGSAATAVADTSNTITQIKGKLADALKPAGLTPKKVQDLVDQLFVAARTAGSPPSAAGSAQSAQAAAFFSHPAVQALSKPPKPGSADKARRPSYVPSSTFATVVLNQATGDHVAHATANDVIANLPAVIRAAVSDIGHEASNVAADGTADLVALRKKIEQFYDTSMQRVAGWYKRRVQLALTVIAILVAVGLNADTIGVANSLWSDTTVRSAIVANAGRTVANPTGVQSSQSITKDLDAVHQLNLPLGWGSRGSGPSATPTDFGSWLSKIAGILLTTFALTLGAPFWFDVLGRVFQIKGTGAQPASTVSQAGATPAPQATTALQSLPAQAAIALQSGPGAANG
jgi:hypothetical protein